MTRRSALGCGAAGVLVVLTVGCAGDADRATTVDSAAVYTAVVRWFVEAETTDRPRPSVFLTSLGEGLGIGLDTQAAIVRALEEFADARFIDEESEALGDDGVRGGGIYLALGPVVADRRRASVECESIRSASTRARYAFELRQRTDDWVVDGVPTRR